MGQETITEENLARATLRQPVEQKVKRLTVL